MIGGLVFFMASQKCHIGKIPFSESEAKRPSGTFRKSIFFFILSTHFIQLFWLRFNFCLMIIFFRPTRKVESMKIIAWKPFLGQKTQMKKMAKNGQIDLCSANHRICNIRYFLIKFSGYFAYGMQFNFFVLLYQAIYLWISDIYIYFWQIFAELPKYGGKWRKHSFLVSTSGASC